MGEELKNARWAKAAKKTISEVDGHDENDVRRHELQAGLPFSRSQIKKSSNELAELSDDNHTMTITLKPFDEEQQKKNVTVATAVKLK